MAPIPPTIGVCAAWDVASWSFWNQRAALIPEGYLRVVRRAGGLTVGLVPVELASAETAALLDRVDGLLLIGGSDLDPASYGAEAAPQLEGTAPLRDRFEITLVRAAFEVGLPVLGICRGLQVLNVASGGSLHQDLAAVGFGEHRPAPGRLDGPTMHGVEVEPEGLLSRIDPAPQWTVNSHHHQGVDRVGEGGRVLARSLPDGVVEAIEWPAQHHALGVQWHPEALELDKTVAAFVAAARLDAVSLADGTPIA
jgi:putative glutamine amidotransferase